MQDNSSSSFICKSGEILLPLARYRLRFKACGAGCLPEYSGSAWRGALGHALKKAVCVTHHKSCQSCLLYRSCPYSYIFETPPHPDAKKMRKYEAAPPRFLIEPPEAPKDGIHELGLTLFGRGNKYLPYLIHALQRAGERGLGKDRLPMKLADVLQARPVDSDTWVRVYQPEGTLQADPPEIPSVPDPPPAVRIKLETHMRLQRDAHLVSPEAFSFSDLFSSLLRRISMLTSFHADVPLETDFAGLTQRAHTVEAVSVNLAWKAWTRYSSRQKTAIRMDGLLGDFIVGLAGKAELWPYLWWGQWVHAGKATSMGLGKYSIQTASLPNP